MDSIDIKKFIQDLLDENESNDEKLDYDKNYIRGFYHGFVRGLNTDWTDETVKNWNDTERSNAAHLIKFLAQEMR